MIVLTKMNGDPFALNCNLIESIIENPDTRISLTNGNLYMVRETMDEVVRRTIEYHRQTLSDILYGRFEKGGLENGR
jgi:flagellar protein FlbD